MLPLPLLLTDVIAVADGIEYVDAAIIAAMAAATLAALAALVALAAYDAAAPIWWLLGWLCLPSSHWQELLSTSKEM